MPEGIAVEVADGFATIDFVNPAFKSPALRSLIEIGGPDSVTKDTRSGPRHLFIVPEDNARAAGLLDEPGLVAEADGVVKHGTEVEVGQTGELVATDTGGPYTQLPSMVDNPAGTVTLDPPAAAPAYPAGKPSTDWTRAQLDAYAKAKHDLDTTDTTDLPDNAAVLDLLK